MESILPNPTTLNEVAVIALQALDDLEPNRTVAAQDRQHNLGQLHSAGPHRAVLLNMIAPSVESLVQATRTE